MTRKSPKQSTAQRRVRASGAPRPIAPEQQLLLDYEGLASRATLSIGTLRRLVRDGKGPKLILIGKHHRFAPRDVTAWIEDLRSLTEA
jgi:hypothetical protein